MADDHATSDKRAIRFQLFTSLRWVSGLVTSRHNRLIDVLNQEYHDTLPVEEARIGGLHDTDGSAAPKGEAFVNVAGVHFGVPFASPADFGAASDRYLRIPKKSARSRLGVGPYDIEGDAFVPVAAVIAPVVLAKGPGFMAMANAVVTRVDDPGFHQGYALVVVNRQHIEYGVLVLSSSS